MNHMFVWRWIITHVPGRCAIKALSYIVIPLTMTTEYEKLILCFLLRAVTVKVVNIMSKSLPLFLMMVRVEGFISGVSAV